MNVDFVTRYEQMKSQVNCNCNCNQMKESRIIHIASLYLCFSSSIDWLYVFSSFHTKRLHIFFDEWLQLKVMQSKRRRRDKMNIHKHGTSYNLEINHKHDTIQNTVKLMIDENRIIIKANKIEKKYKQTHCVTAT